jgi:hypothetical protein
MSDDDEPVVFNGDEIPEEAKQALDEFFRNHPEMMNDEGVAVFSNENIHEMPEPVREIIHRMIAGKMVQHLAHKAVSGHAPGADRLNDEYMPSPGQLNLQAGDKCVVSYGGVEDQSGEILLCELLDPQEYEETFPDWEERVYNGWLLARYWTKDHLELENDPDLGWFSRISLMKIEEEWQWSIYWEWMKAGTLPENPPPWVLTHYLDVFAGISDNNQQLLPNAYQCVECGSKAVLLVATRSEEFKYFVGQHPRYDEDYETKDGVYAYTRYGKKEISVTHIECYEEVTTSAPDHLELPQSMWYT